MPRTRLDRKKNDALGVLLNGYVYKDGGNLTTGSEKTGLSRATLCRRLAAPGNFTVDELLDFGRKYQVPIEDLRAAIRY